MSEFKVGTEVALFKPYWGGGRMFAGFHKIRKFYKNGNFVLEGDSLNEQYNSSGCRTSAWAREYCVVATPEVREKVAAEQKQKKRDKIAREVIKKIERLNDFTEAEVEVLTKLDVLIEARKNRKE